MTKFSVGTAVNFNRFLKTDESSGSGTSLSITQQIGTASSNRNVIIHVSCEDPSGSNTPGIASATINGVSASIIVQTNTTTGFRITGGMIGLNVTSGTSMSLVVNFNSVQTWQVTTYVTTELSNIIPVETKTSTNWVSGLTSTLTFSSSAKIGLVLYSAGAAPVIPKWTNVQHIFYGPLSPSPPSYGSGLIITPNTFTITSGATTNGVFIGATWN